MSSWQQWQGLPYYAISCFYREAFGTRVYKIPVSLADSCPNREGIRGMQTCNFCDEWGSAAFPEFRAEDLATQIEQTRARIQRRFNGAAYLVYFQAYTTTFAKSSRLREQFQVALSYSDVKGVVVGTRPDCLSPAVLDLWQETLAQGHFVGIELGVQSLVERHLTWMRRGHSAAKAIEAIQRIKSRMPINLGIHLMFGLPGETDEEIIQTADQINQLPIDNVKLHNLHVIKGTPLADEFLRGDFVPIERDDYIRRVVLFLERLNPKIAVHRLTAVASRHEELLAPAWARSKMESYQMTLDEFARLGTFQGRLFEPSHSPERLAFGPVSG
ncbi:MAG: TIGR01212 family radical SAM protein [Bdellovibrionales bacterium]|nr:TIGR01212 family radical SAM protein [Bdellovibrionales bacterium]